VEWLLAAIFLVLTLKFGPSKELLAYSMYTTVLALISMIDARHRYVYRVVTLPGILIAVLAGPTLLGMEWISVLGGLGAGLVVFLVLYVVGRLVYRDREPVGKGDIELAALVGAMVGLPRIAAALFLGSAVNAVFIIWLLITRRSGMREFIPYGPGLCIGAFLTFFLPF